MNAILERRRALVAADKKGFTLVEVVVVLVILAILMAIAIPALTGYIDKARRDATVAEAGAALSAAQVIVTDAYGHPVQDSTPNTFYVYKDGTNVLVWNDTWGTPNTGTPPSSTGSLAGAIEKLTGVTYDTATAINTVDSENKITKMTVKLKNGKTAVFESDNWTVS